MALDGLVPSGVALGNVHAIGSKDGGFEDARRGGGQEAGTNVHPKEDGRDVDEGAEFGIRHLTVRSFEPCRPFENVFAGHGIMAIEFVEHLHELYQSI